MGLRINHCEIIKLTARCLEMTSCWYCLLFAAGLGAGSQQHLPGNDQVNESFQTSILPFSTTGGYQLF